MKVLVACECSGTQQIQPYEYGDPYSKRTLLWLKNLPRKARSITFQGIADAMADQWGDPKQQTL